MGFAVAWISAGVPVSMMHPVVEHGDAVRHLVGADHVVGDDDRGHAEIAFQAR